MLVNQFLLLAAVLFCIGVYGVLTRRNGVLVLMSIELILNSVNLNLIAFGGQHGVDGQAPETRDVEDAFGDDDTADQQRDADADDGDDRHRRVAQRMAQDDPDLRQALGSRGPI